MKKILSYILLGGVIAFSSCDKKEVDYTPKDFAEAPAISVSVAAVEDSTAYVDFTTAGVGQLYLAFTEGEDETVTPEAIITGKVGSAIISESMDLTEEGTFSLTFNDLVQDTDYFLYSVSGSVDGEYQKEVTVTPVSTTDIHGPSFIGRVSEEDADISGVIQFVFDEPVEVQSGAVIRFVSWFTSTVYEIGADKITTEGNIVNADFSEFTFFYGDAELVTISAGAFKDAAGNDSGDVDWAHDGENFTRLDYYFWIRGETVSEVMANFLGMNDYQFSDPFGVNSTGQEVVALKAGTEDVVQVYNFLHYVYGIPDVIDYKFNFEDGVLEMHKTESSLYYNLDPDNPDENGLYGGDPTEPFHYRIYYLPVDGVSYSGEFDVDTQQFVVRYEVAFELGSYGVVDQMYQKSTEVTAVSKAMKDAAAGLYKNSGNVSGKIDTGDLKLRLY